MNSPQVNIVPIACRLHQLTVFTTAPDPALPATILREDKPFSLQVTVEFEGPGAIALMPLCPAVQVEFYVKPFSPDAGQVLGSVAVDTQANVLRYQPTLSVASPLSLGMAARTIYLVGAVLRVGAPNWPALINGFTEELTIEVYAAQESSPSTRSKLKR